jgi:two-component system response regulator MprA
MNTTRTRRYAYRGSQQAAMSTAKDRGRVARQILVVEDDAGSRRALVNVLEDRGYSVLGVGSAIEALDFLADQPLPELIILDLMLPDMEGWDFRHRQKKIPAIAAIPVIGVSAVGKLVDVEYSLRKPLDYDEFVHAVEAYVEPPDHRRNKARVKASQPT